MRCIIITPYLKDKIRDCVRLSRNDFIICADKAFRTALSEGINPDLVIGDFDSDGVIPPAEIKTEKYPPEKDDTDTLLCVRRAIALGYDDILIVGGIGGRLDHTVANIQTLIYAKNHGAEAILCDKLNSARIVTGKAEIPRRDGYYLSLFSVGGDAVVSISGVKYPLRNKTLTADFPLGVSNLITSANAELDVASGTVLVVESRDK